MASTGKITKARVLGEYGIVQAEGKVSLEVVGNSSKPWINPKLKEVSATYKHSYLVNFKAIEARKALATMEAFGEEDSMSLEDFNFNMVKEMIVHEGQAEPTLPISGEKVDCNIAFAKNRETGEFATDVNGEKILEIRSMVVKVASEVASFGSFANKVTETTTPQRQPVGAEGDDTEY